MELVELAQPVMLVLEKTVLPSSANLVGMLLLVKLPVRCVLLVKLVLEQT